MGCEGRALQSLWRTRFSLKPRAGRYAQSTGPRPHRTPLAGGELGDLVCGYLVADATISSRLQWNSPSSAYRRCMITASLRATATVAR
jgi:hypothetical protein